MLKFQAPHSLVLARDTKSWQKEGESVITWLPSLVLCSCPALVTTDGPPSEPRPANSCSSCLENFNGQTGSRAGVLDPNPWQPGSF